MILFANEPRNDSKQSPLGLYLFQSPDAIHWSMIGHQPEIPAGDAQPVAFWDTTREQYVMFHKMNRPDPNAVKGAWLNIATTTSEDFVNWTNSTQLQYPDTPDQHMYHNAIQPYYRAPDVFMGLPARMLRDRFGDNEDIPHDQVSDAVNMTSRDGVNFNRWGEALIRPRPEGWGQQHWGGHINNMPAAGIVETNWDPAGNYQELSLYAVEGYFFPEEGNRLRRYTQRLDGFVSVQAPLAGAEFVTKPIVFDGNELEINFSTSGMGWVLAEIQDAQGNPINGFSLAESSEIFGDSLERTVSWAGSSDLSSLSGQPVRLRFALSDADLYSFRFNNDPPDNTLTLDWGEPGRSTLFQFATGHQRTYATVNLASNAEIRLASDSVMYVAEQLNLHDYTLIKTGSGTLTIDGGYGIHGGKLIGAGGVIDGSGTLGGDLHNFIASCAETQTFVRSVSSNVSGANRKEKLV
jgi:hypothetical protein